MVCVYTHKHTLWTAVFHTLMPYEAIALIRHFNKIKKPPPLSCTQRRMEEPAAEPSELLTASAHIPRIHRGGTPGQHTQPNSGVTNLVVFLEVQ